MSDSVVLKPLVLSSLATLDSVYRCVTFHDRLKLAIAKSEIMPVTEAEFADIKTLYDEYLKESSLLMAFLSLQLRDPKSLPHLRARKFKSKNTIYVKLPDSNSYRTEVLPL